jgi:hypothetical protein
MPVTAAPVASAALALVGQATPLVLAPPVLPLVLGAPWERVGWALLPVQAQRLGLDSLQVMLGSVAAHPPLVTELGLVLAASAVLAALAGQLE